MNHDEIKETGIDGAMLQDLRMIETEGGPVLHMLKSRSPLVPDFSKGFGEIYFSEVLPGKVKAWKRHQRQCQLFTVPHGLLELVLFDARPLSRSHGQLRRILLGRPKHYALLRIPPKIWYGFRALGNDPALICNCTDIPHDPNESERLPWDAPMIPWQWQA